MNKKGVLTLPQPTGYLYPYPKKEQIFRCVTLQFCIAELLNLPYSIVPNFEDYGMDWKNKFENWLHGNFGLEIVPVEPNFYFRGRSLGVFMDYSTPMHRWPDGENYHSIFFIIMQANQVTHWPEKVNQNTALHVQKLIFTPLDITVNMNRNTLWVN